MSTDGDAVLHVGDGAAELVEVQFGCEGQWVGEVAADATRADAARLQGAAVGHDGRVVLARRYALLE